MVVFHALPVIHFDQPSRTLRITLGDCADIGLRLARRPYAPACRGRWDLGILTGRGATAG